MIKNFPSSVGIATIDRINGTIVLIGFTDGTSASFTAGELLALRPDRAQSDDPSDTM